MCGLVGALFLKDKKINSNQLENSLNKISYRGPDASDIFEDEKIILGHRRLSIIDLSENAKQPMQLKCSKTNRNLIIAFNGEIYNYKSLISQLKQLGHSFYSDSDTEAILHSYEEWGSNCFEKLRGMFAFVLWDAGRQELILLRDRFGIKPLYYYQDNNYFIFASEIKAILGFKEISKQINPLATQMFLRQGWISQPQTFYKNIFALEAGMFMIVKNKEITKNLFADIQNDFLQEKEKISFSDAVKKTKSALLDSASTHLVADVEIGAFLSGGIDSSALIALMRELNQKRITTVSAIFPNTPYDESEKINFISKKFNTNHINLEISGKDFIENIDNIFSYMDEPTVDGVNTYFVSLAVKKAGLKVVLSGLGGDELFFGYPSFIDIPKLLKLSPLLKSSFGRMILKSFFAKDNFNQKIAKLLQISNNADRFQRNLLREMCQREALQTDVSQLVAKSFTCESIRNVYLSYRGLFSDEQINRILLSNENKNTIEIKNREYDTEKTNDVLAFISYLEFTNYMKNQLLRDSDVFSMAHSIELRVPFVDNVLLGTITKMPNEYQIKNRTQKYLLINALKDLSPHQNNWCGDLLPQEILNQKKQGFVLPIDLWLKNEARELVKKELLNSEVFEQKTVKLLLDKFFSRKLHWSRIWSLFVLNRFLKQ